MNRDFAPYMTYGKKVESHWTGSVYKLIEDMSVTASVVLGVDVNRWERYHTLKTWERNWEQNSAGFRERFPRNIEEVKQERISYETELKVSDITPCDKIRFIDSSYNTKFEIKNFGRVKVGKEIRRVVYIDDYHFYLMDTKTEKTGVCYHICQFAEQCENQGIEVQQITQ